MTLVDTIHKQITAPLSLANTLTTHVNATSTAFAEALARTSGLFGEATERLLRPFEGLLEDIEPLWTVRHMNAKVVAIEAETPSVKSFILQPSIHWRGFKAGQSIRIGIQQEGVFHHRYYSLSCSPESFKQSGFIRITVKRVPDGQVSPFLHQSVRVGDVLAIGPAQGEFILGDTATTPDDVAPTHLFIAGGSGITPIMSMLESLYHTHHLARATLLYSVRDAGELIFRSRLLSLAKQHPSFRIVPLFSESRGHISQADLASEYPGASTQTIYLCGPGGFRRTVLAHLDALGMNLTFVRQESFGMRADDQVPLTNNAKDGRVCFERSGKTIDSDGSASLLMLAERAGLNPRYGCRSGICHECSCQRGSGQLMDIRTGELIASSQEQIQPCITLPVGDVSLPSW